MGIEVGVKLGVGASKMEVHSTTVENSGAKSAKPSTAEDAAGASKEAHDTLLAISDSSSSSAEGVAGLLEADNNSELAEHDFARHADVPRDLGRHGVARLLEADNNSDLDEHDFARHADVPRDLGELDTASKFIICKPLYTTVS